MPDFLRHRQRPVTAVSPHNGNRRYIIPSRSLDREPGDPPNIPSVPTIDNTSPIVGDLLTATPSEPVAGTPPIVRSWQWLRDGASIPGATSDTFTVTWDEFGAALTVRQTERNGWGTHSVTSAPTSAVTASPPAIPAVPTIDNTSPTAGDVLTATPSTPVTGTPPITRSWQWLRDGIDIPGPSEDTYLTVEADIGAAISVRQFETNGAGTDTSTSDPTAPVQSPITGVPHPDAIYSAWDGSQADTITLDGSSHVTTWAAYEGTVPFSWTSAESGIGEVRWTEPKGGVLFNGEDGTTGLLSLPSIRNAPDAHRFVLARFGSGVVSGEKNLSFGTAQSHLVYNGTTSRITALTTSNININGVSQGANNGPLIAAADKVFLVDYNMENGGLNAGKYLGGRGPWSGNEQYTWPGWIHEVIVCNRVLTAQEIADFQGYLMTKWGIEAGVNLPS